ncbi:hypothetical protein [Streptomyces sp. NPDC086010]|uniref:hypothetical protein n=1 Tax=Streptomyces sp. NPDC086010 TaxID=3365745 RepID=UPI0037CDD590
MRQLLRPAAAVTALAALTACGIQETDVIGANGPATIDVLPARQVRMMLFFLSPDGALMPVPRMVGGGDATGFGENYGGEEESGEGSADAGRPPTVKVVAALVAGPQEAERRAGLRSDPTLAALDAAVRVSPSGNGVDVTTAAPLSGLTEAARRQLVCTIAFAESPDGGVMVTLRGSDGALAPERCDAWAVPTPAGPSSRGRSGP